MRCRCLVEEVDPIFVAVIGILFSAPLTVAVIEVLFSAPLTVAVIEVLFARSKSSQESLVLITLQKSV